MFLRSITSLFLFSWKTFNEKGAVHTDNCRQQKGCVMKPFNVVIVSKEAYSFSPQQLFPKISFHCVDYKFITLEKGGIPYSLFLLVPCIGATVILVLTIDAVVVFRSSYCTIRSYLQEMTIPALQFSFSRQ